ncbi:MULTISPECIES: hypothetical protein [Butyricimonas]|uniref:hypothetical protein n=1 Tax=Butyricimonas TaxID=574697 RepID=UPI001D0944BE|nr:MULTISPECIES: hypothetical protein [Butyricimonas]MCB6973958.1 hypothetical protein [Butyricimonas synergistica]MCG4520699.1 hypothetical protein [Butyricimonas sp. DFI.6.44]
MNYFVIGMFSTLSFNSVLSQMVDHLFAGVVSIAGGIVSSIAVAWVKRRWERRKQ